MKIASFNHFHVGVVDGNTVYDMTDLLPSFLNGLPRQRVNWLISNWAEMLPIFKNFKQKGKAYALDYIQLLSANPGAPNVFAAPANYQKHIGELGDRAITKPSRSARQQGFFLKSPASMVGSGNHLLLPKGSTRRFDHESELAVIIGKAGRHIPQKDAMSHIFGYACLIDATMRIEPGVAEEERSMRKSFETFTPTGPYLVTADEVPNPSNLKNRLWVNNVLKQNANTSEMIVGIAELIEMISSVLPIQVGDVIATGTPEGVGPMEIDDIIRIEIDCVGTMVLKVKACDTTAPRAY
jgi:2-keto-4-pentenoate hydratase/2-oxohepta-3-ene-1,7-dioic acid hydratase in catechol pathway